MCKEVFTCPDYPGCSWIGIGPQESLNRLAIRLRTTPLRLLELNPYLDPSELIEGMPILAPLAHVHYGQTVRSLLTDSGLNNHQFLLLNPHFNGRFPLPGQRYRRG